MRRWWLWVAIVLGFAIATPIVIGPVRDNHERKVDVYRAFLNQYGEGAPLNLSNTASRFDASKEGGISCLPSAMLTSLVAQTRPPPTFSQTDFNGVPVRVVDQDVQIELIRQNDPMSNIAAPRDIGAALDAAFASGLLSVSDVGFDVTGQRALLTYSFSCGSLCGHHGVALLERSAGHWTVSDRRCGSFGMS